MSDSAPSTPDVDPIAEQRDALMDRLTKAGQAMFELCTIYIGERLRYYDALMSGPLTSIELAARTETNERYAREWLEQQATAGLLAVDDPAAAATARRFELPPAHRNVLGDRASEHYLGAMVRFNVGVAHPVADVVEAFRSGRGVPYEAYGADLREGMAECSRQMQLEFRLIGDVLMPVLPDLDARLRADPPARVAEIGCGAAWGAIALAQIYPKASIDGFDLDPPSVDLARRNVVATGLSDRIRIELRDASDSEFSGRYDLVLNFACVHDTPRPVDMLRTMRRLAGEAGTVLVVEPWAGERFLDLESDPDIERSHYGFSVLHCLPVGMSEQPSAATGTVMRPNVLRAYALEAGFRDVEQLRIDDPWTACFRLRI